MKFKKHIGSDWHMIAPQADRPEWEGLERIKILLPRRYGEKPTMEIVNGDMEAGWIVAINDLEAK